MRAKKRFGQHFLHDENIARKIADALTFTRPGEKTKILEIGGGTGRLTRFLLLREEYEVYVVEIERDAIAFLKENFPQLDGHLIEGDFLKLKLEEYFSYPLPVIGNIPYNITGPIFFKILDYRDMIPEAVLMIQKEVAQRVVAHPNSKEYGVLSVMLQSYYHTEYLFSVPPGAFRPRPKVMSAVVRLRRRSADPPVRDYDFFRYVVKTAFNQRRKTVRNSMKGLYNLDKVPEDILDKRAEQLILEEFWHLASLVE